MPQKYFETFTSHHQFLNFTLIIMDTQKFLGLFQEVLAREPSEIPFVHFNTDLL